MRVRGAGGGRVSIAGVACYRPGDRPHLYYHLRVHRRRKGEPKGFTWSDYRDLIIAAHHNLSAPLVWCWDNLNIHLAPELADFAAENKEWLRVYRLPAYAPDLNPAEGIWSLLKRSIANFAAADQAGLVRIIKRKLKKIQYRPHLIDGCLAATGLKNRTLVTPCTTSSTWLIMSKGNRLLGRRQQQDARSDGREVSVIDGMAYNNREQSKIFLLTTALDHVWRWYDLRMNCGLQILNFYLLAIAVLTTAYVSALNARNHVVSVAVALAGAAVTACAYMVGARQDHVARMALTSIQEVETRLADTWILIRCDWLNNIELSGSFRRTLSAIGHFVYPSTIIVCLVAAIYAAFIRLFTI